MRESVKFLEQTPDGPPVKDSEGLDEQNKLNENFFGFVSDCMHYLGIHIFYILKIKNINPLIPSPSLSNFALFSFLRLIFLSFHVRDRYQ